MGVEEVVAPHHGCDIAADVLQRRVRPQEGVEALLARHLGPAQLAERDREAAEQERGEHSGEHDLDGGNPRREVHYGVTSVPKSRANRRQLLTLSRGHWTIENCVHWVRDVTFDEDRSQIRKGAGAPVMASLRNLAMNLLRLAGATCIAAAARYCSYHPDAALRLVGV